MAVKPQQIPEEFLCFNAEKVYDWVMLETTINRTILAADLGVLPIEVGGPTVTNLTTECFLTDAAGNRLTPNTSVDFTETQDREDRPFTIDGNEVILQRVAFDKTLYVVIEFTGILGTTPFVFQTIPIPVIIPESLFMCAPVGTDLIVRLTDFTCSLQLNITADVLVSVDISLNVCQSVQSTANVTVELETNFCEPRELLTEQCATPTIPRQCPILFP